jgi:hypothetical protein
MVAAEELATVDPILRKIIDLGDLLDEAIASHHGARNAYVSNDRNGHGSVRGAALAQKHASTS